MEAARFSSAWEITESRVIISTFTEFPRLLVTNSHIYDIDAWTLTINGEWKSFPYGVAALWEEVARLMDMSSMMRICYMKYVWRSQKTAAVSRLQGQGTLCLQ